MTATDELRKLLDERGVEHIGNDDERDEATEPLTTTWEYTQCGYEMVVTAIEVRDTENKPYLDMDFYYYFTPEQAIAATLGNRAITAEQVMTIARKHQPDYCSDTHVCFDWQAIADELNATLGSHERTCHNTSHRLDKSRFHCSECEFGCWVKDVADGRDKLPSYCPNCGRKVVGE